MTTESMFSYFTTLQEIMAPGIPAYMYPNNQLHTKKGSGHYASFVTMLRLLQLHNFFCYTKCEQKARGNL